MRRLRLAALALLVVLLGCGLADPVRPGFVTDEMEAAYEACQVYLRERLAAPSTAEFPELFGPGEPGDPVGASVFNADSNLYRVSITFDAQNRMGALVRWYGSCRLDGGTYEPLDPPLLMSR